jgi:LysM repeat protein
VVSEVDTLLSIAVAHYTTPEDLAKLNGLSEDSIIGIGDELQVPGSVSTAASTSSSATRGAPSRYVVKEGDTLLGIALAHDTTAKTILQLNNLDESDFLQIGQELAIP